MTLTAKEYAWCYLLSNGVCTGKINKNEYNSRFSYYAGRFEDKPSHTRKCLQAIIEGKVDWGKTREPEDDCETTFDGTFNDGTRVKVLTGVLHMTDGTQYHWGCNFEDFSNVFKMLAFMSSCPSIDDVVNARIGKKGKV